MVTNNLVIIMLFVLSLLTLIGIISIFIILWRIPKKCPKCGKKMNIASINMICKKCGHVEITVH